MYFHGIFSCVKGFRLYDVQKIVLFISRGVIFFEDAFPFESVRIDLCLCLQLIP